MIHAKPVYIELNGVYCSHCKKWTSRNTMLRKLRANPIAKCKCGSELFATTVGDKTNERATTERNYKRNNSYIN